MESELHQVVAVVVVWVNSLKYRCSSCQQRVLVADDHKFLVVMHRSLTDPTSMLLHRPSFPGVFVAFVHTSDTAVPSSNYNRRTFHHHFLPPNICIMITNDCSVPFLVTLFGGVLEEQEAKSSFNAYMHTQYAKASWPAVLSENFIAQPFIL